MSSLKITCHLPDGELVNSNEISAKMISFIRKGQLRLPADVDAALADCRACFISALLDPSVVEALDSPTAIFVAADGNRSEPIAVGALDRACIVHALPDGKPLPASMGGPLCVRFSAGAPVKRSVNGVIGLEVRGGGAAAPTAAAAPPPAPTSDSLTMRLDGADVRRQLAAMAAEQQQPTTPTSSTAAAPAPNAADAEAEWARLKAEAQAALTAEREAAASRDKDLHSELDKGFKNLFTGLSVLFVAIAMALCGGALKPKLE